jgi:hypothetical protein
MSTLKQKRLAITVLPLLALLTIIALPSLAAAQIIDNCSCSSSNCQSCQPETCNGCAAGCQSCRPARMRLGGGIGRLRTRKCPECECDSCVLKLDEIEVKKSCFKTEQKEICIPKIRFPWQKCCPPGTSKSKVVTVLKKHSYKCKECSYKWSVNEPEFGEATKTTPAEIIYQPTHQPTYQTMPTPTQAEAPTLLPYETSAPMVDSVLPTGTNR